MSATNLIDALTSEPHSWKPDYTFLYPLEREHPNGDPITVEVEVGVDWDGTPKPETRYYTLVKRTQDIGEGLSVNEGSFIMLTDEEQDDFNYSEEVMEIYKEGLAADDHQRDSERYYASTRI